MDGSRLEFTDATADIVRLIESKRIKQARKLVESRPVSQTDRKQLSRQHNDRAVIAVLEGQLIRARKGFRRAIELDPECQAARENLKLLDEDVNLSRISSDIAFPKCLVLLITYNRIEYTKQCLEALLDVDYPDLEIVIWDNASTDGTQQYLEEETCGIANLTFHFSKTNEGVVRPMNEVWSSNRSADILAKLDNDTRVPSDWLKRLVPCHFASEKLGVLSGFHFREEGEKIAKETDIVTVGDHRVLKQMFVGGCAITIRRELFEKFAPIPEGRPSKNGPFLDSGWTQFQQRLGDAGYWNGYPWPCGAWQRIYQEAMKPKVFSVQFPVLSFQLAPVVNTRGGGEPRPSGSREPFEFLRIPFYEECRKPGVCTLAALCQPGRLRGPFAKFQQPGDLEAAGLRR